MNASRVGGEALSRGVNRGRGLTGSADIGVVRTERHSSPDSLRARSLRKCQLSRRLGGIA
jgi:hypothetical protein